MLFPVYDKLLLRRKCYEKQIAGDCYYTKFVLYIIQKY